MLRAAVLCDGHVLTEDEFPQIKAQVRGVSLPASFAAPEPPQAPSNAVDPGRQPVEAQPGLAPGLISGLDAKGNVRPLSDVEQEMIEMAIAYYGGQMSEVARRLGIGRSTLYRKLKEYGIDPEAGPGTLKAG